MSSIAKGPCPSALQKKSNNRDGCQRRSHRFHVSWPSYRAAGSATGCYSWLLRYWRIPLPNKLLFLYEILQMKEWVNFFSEKRKSGSTHFSEKSNIWSPLEFANGGGDNNICQNVFIPVERFGVPSIDRFMLLGQATTLPQDIPSFKCGVSKVFQSHINSWEKKFTCIQGMEVKYIFKNEFLAIFTFYFCPFIRSSGNSHR